MLQTRRDCREFTIIAAVAVIVGACAYGVAMSAASNSPGIELLLIIGLAIVAFCGPALAFREHNQQSAEAETKIRAHHKSLNEVLENMTQGFCRFDADHRLTIANDQFARLYSLSPHQVKVGMTPREILDLRIAKGNYHGKDPEAYLQERLECASATEESLDFHELPDGRVLAVRHRPLDDGGWLATHEDVTEFRKVEQQIAYMESFDPVTDLANRASFRTKIADVMQRGGRDEKFAVLIIDLERFKSVNDTLGHQAGDQLLKLIGKRLQGCLKDDDMIARLGGDEFAVFQASSNQPYQATVLASLMCAVMKEPFELDGHQLVTEASVGIALAPDDGNDPDQLIKNAGLALRRAKSEGRGIYRFFETGQDARMKERRALEFDMRNAINDAQFKLFYQPLMNALTEEVSGFEALLRWNHPLRGPVSPEEFIPLAEESGLIVSLGNSVIRQACEDAAKWPDPVRVAINISAAQFRSANIVNTVIQALSRSSLPANRLELEITESALLDKCESTLDTLYMLRNLGVRIAMDDFGTGYSSLSYLRSFPFDKIKLDRSFLLDIDDDAKKDEALAIVRAVASLGSSLGMTTTAEGVETEQQLEMVRAEGYNEIQGFYYSKPRPAEEILEVYFPPEAVAASGGA